MLLNNPKFYNLQRLGRDTRWTKPTVEVPVLESEELKAEGETNIALYDNQQPVYDYAKNRSSCLIEAQTGFGKTVLAIAMHQSSGGSTLVACHSLVLVEQFADEFKKFLPQVKVTQYCGGKKDMSGDVVITTHATFRKDYKLFN